MSESSHTPIHLNISSEVPSASHIGGITDLYDVVDAIGLMTIDDVDNLEANLIMDLARARRDVFVAGKTLADCVVQEHEVMTNLSKYKSAISKQKLDKADVGLGHMCITFKKHGLSHCSMPPGFHDSFTASQCHVTIQLD
ncbi:uncharacterized protein F5891DRAFT_1197913 [Suillus fuscotomentosus]|uniref:Uncharacterized protein n=1 Tax=Suillus fuscotomentosus TaxID=1912939 RepID=A0AAD4DR05_9AGAM|nr:uncharacterized protein F5891DRAFT_1197913 [Suillus fuscotomentosus]KAG1890636.1 hypothetical protein F5891DRAFT_1197913 [Suillus fuscotomentosus]